MPSIVAINGSARSGNTADVLQHAASVAAARGVGFESIPLRDIRMTPCGPCGDCNDRPIPCAVTDDVAEVVEKMVAADGVIFAGPVYGFGSASLLQTFIERAGVGYLRFDRPLSNKVAGVIAVARRYSPSDVINQLTNNVLLNRMILVGSGFPAIVQALNAGDARSDTEGLTNVTRMVDRMIDMIVLLDEHRRLTGRPDVLVPQNRNERVGLALDEARPA